MKSGAHILHYYYYYYYYYSLFGGALILDSYNTIKLRDFGGAVNWHTAIVRLWKNGTD